MKCEKCGKEYWTRECLNCKNNPNANKKSNNLLLYLIVTIVAIAIIALINININSNPLIGEWNSKSNILGKNKIIFKSDSIETMGMISKVKYDIEENRVIVTDEWGIGTIINIIDDNTLESNLAGIKTIYKKVK
ncbi:hypothetical protein [Sulfurimonas sp.]|uniref:hypothetical protein n=1 Tax=Sulfurimonas sp. TaxID=2022749 RepID=UPI0019E98BD8|nr:hypothetical protein [Sulfurimonas sp.]MBE0515519.1 hypothetical protein [Sulfurimonas sp.]